MKWRMAAAVTSVVILSWASWRAVAQQTPPQNLNVPTNSLPAATVLRPAASKVEPNVRIEWVGPTSIRVGQTNEFTLCVRNLSPFDVENVSVSSCGPILSADPKPAEKDGSFWWGLGTLAPRQEKQILVRIAATKKGPVMCPAHVTFTGQANLQVQANEPALGVGISGTGSCNLNDGSPWQVTVHNTGDGLAEQVRLRVELPVGIEHPRGRLLDFEFGNLQAGESRAVQVIGVARQGGDHTVKAQVSADGDLYASTSAVVSVVAPRLDVAVHGPKLRYLDRKATYRVKVTNPGDAAAGNVLVQDVLPAGFKFVGADNGGRFDSTTRTVSWFVGEIPAGQSREVAVELQASTAGEFQHAVSAQGARGLRADANFATRVEGLSAIQVEVVDSQDPVEVGGETTYQIKLVNTGTQTETDLRLSLQLPDKMQLVSVSGPTSAGQRGHEVVFETLPRLAARAEVVYKVTCRATAPGVAHFKTLLSSTLLVEPVQKVEPTRIYED